MLILPMQFLLLSASMTGDTSWTDAWAAVRDVAVTHSGRTIILELCFVPVLLLFSIFQSNLRHMKFVLFGVALEVSFIACRALHGHAASDGDLTLREGIQFLHLATTAVWAGGVLVAGLITVPTLASAEETASVLAFGKRLSGTVSVALIVVIVTGVYNSWKGLGKAMSPLVVSTWGHMLLLKLFFVLLAFGHGIRTRLLFRAIGPWTPNQTMTMRRWMRAEALFMLLVFVCSAWLSNLPPDNM